MSHACANLFGARADADANGFSLLGDNAIPGTEGRPSLARYVADGYVVLTF